MRTQQFFRRIHHFESRTGLVLLLVRIGLSVYLAWSGVLMLSTDPVFGGAFIALGAVLLLGILRRLMALLVVVALIAQLLLFGTINPATSMAVLVGVALLIGPSR